MTFHPSFVMRSAVRRPVVGAIVAITALSSVWSGTAHADPPQDAMAQLNELSKQAEQLSQTMQSAQRDYDEKLRLLSAADKRQADDLAALEAARTQLVVHQGAVDRFAATVYMGGRPDGITAILTAPSPKVLIDKLSVQRMVTTEMTAQMKSYRQVSQEAQTIAAASAKSAADARAAADQAAAVRADLLSKQSQLRAQVAEVNARFDMLPLAQRAVRTTPSPSVMAALGMTSPVPTVGMGGLVPNARMLAAYIIATYPGVRSIGGVRSDPLPDHPSGRAIDVMIGSDMALGDAINADIQSQAARFGVSYTMWRVASHYDHVHITVN